MMKYRYVGKSELGECPAAVDMNDGTIEVNRDVWGKYTPDERRFILLHEVGHYELDTDDETEADKYAINKMAGTCDKSLAKCMDALYKIGVIDQNRLNAIYREALRLDTIMGNPNAQKVLDEYDKGVNELKRTIKKQNKMKKNRYRADGESAVPTTKKGNTQHKQNGITLGDYYFSFTNVLLLAILVVLFKIMKG